MRSLNRVHSWTTVRVELIHVNDISMDSITVKIERLPGRMGFFTSIFSSSAISYRLTKDRMNHTGRRKLPIASGTFFAATSEQMVACVRAALTIGAMAIFPATALAQTSGLITVGPFPGGTTTTPNAVTGDGSLVVGSADISGGASRAFLWTPAAGMVNLGVLNAGINSFAYGVNSNGTVVVGEATDGVAGNALRAYRWTQSTGMVSLGVLPGGGNTSTATAVNGNGTVVVGYAQLGPLGSPQAFRWTQAQGMVSLGRLNNGGVSQANAVSSDGSVVVGRSQDGAVGVSVHPERAFRWTQSTGMVSLGVLSGGFTSNAMAVSGDGSIVVGNADVPGANRAFRWTQADGMVNLGVLNAGTNSLAYGVSSDGAVVVGQATDGAANNVNRAFRWTQSTGMQSVETWLRANGIRVATDITSSASGVSADGSVVVGQLANNLGFIARVSPTGSGLISLQDVSTSLSGNNAASVQAASLGELVLNGAHSRPLAHRVASGRSCAWASGDFGRDDHESRDGRIGLAEVGGCHGFSPDLQASISVGQSWSRQNLVFNGASDARANYGIAELLGRVTDGLWASSAVLYQSGNIDAQRGYLNAGAQDFSRGRPGVHTTALRVRVDWDDAAHLGKATVTPYADVTYVRSEIDTYTETGGGFPARFDARTEKDTELHLGTDVAYPLSSNTTLRGRLEAAHRFETTGASNNGTMRMYGRSLM